MSDKNKLWISRETLVGIADAIRAKKGTTEEIPVTELASEISSIESGGVVIETGSLTLLDGCAKAFEIVYPCCNTDGSIVSVQETYYGDGDGDVTLNNIPLGAPIAFYSSSGEGIDMGDAQGIAEISFSTTLSCRLYKLTASNATASFL